jgi:hypothetical protein
MAEKLEDASNRCKIAAAFGTDNRQSAQGRRNPRVVRMSKSTSYRVAQALD